jgi:archaellum component FlaF (FlaF/FlaG flagellin family)
VSNGIENIFTKKIHTETLCVKKVDGGEVCLNGDELEIIMNGGIISSNTSKYYRIKSRAKFK